MHVVPVIAVFDVGKTNKKIFLFNEQYGIVYEEAVQFSETVDEDNFPCEDLTLLSGWIIDSFRKLLLRNDFFIKAINFSAYGASFVHVDKYGKPVLPLYSYLKPFPADLHTLFYSLYGGEEAMALQTASPVLGNLNSGLQLYRLKKQQPHVYHSIDCSLHLPQYLVFLLTGRKYADVTSIGCHTALWNFKKGVYHHWVYNEGLDAKFAPIHKGNKTFDFEVGGRTIAAGAGLHDSSAALIPYLTLFNEPFLLISTGTWCISLNPFNHSTLTQDELKQDCLFYMSYQHKPVKASRLFSGKEHEVQSKRIAAHFKVAPDFYKEIAYDPDTIQRVQAKTTPGENALSGGTPAVALNRFMHRDLASFADVNEAYHQLMLDIAAAQLLSTQLVLNNSPVKRIFVDGGFSNNDIYMNLLSSAFPQREVFAASMPQATALGAAVAIHEYWNPLPFSSQLINLRYFANTRPAPL